MFKSVIRYREPVGCPCAEVFLGLGLPWTIGAIYWAALGLQGKAAETLSEKSLTGELSPDDWWFTKYRGESSELEMQFSARRTLLKRLFCLARCC